MGEMGEVGTDGKSPFSRTANQHLPNETVRKNIRKRPVYPLGLSKGKC
jgi:hypothetical protein